MIACLWYQGLLKKDGHKPNPSDFRSGALSVGPDLEYDSTFRALSQ